MMAIFWLMSSKRYINDLTFKQLGIFFKNVILFPSVIESKCSIFCCLKLVQCNGYLISTVDTDGFSTSPSVVTVLSAHPCISSYLWAMGGGGGGGGSEKLIGCAAGHWKFDSKRSREKWDLRPKRSNFVRIDSSNTPKDSFGIDGWEKVPQKDRVQSPECKKKGVKTAAHPYHPT